MTLFLRFSVLTAFCNVHAKMQSYIPGQLQDRKTRGNYAKDFFAATNYRQFIL